MATLTTGSARTGLTRSTLAAVSATAATGGLAVGTLAAIEQAGRGPLTVDAAVAAVVLTLGTVAGGLLTIGCVLLAAGAAVTSLGRSARRIEAAAALLTPAVLRRAVAVTVGTGLGLAAASGAATASEIDLGWTITTESAASVGSEPDPAHTATRAAITTATIRPGPGSLAPLVQTPPGTAVPMMSATPAAPPPAAGTAAADAVTVPMVDTVDTVDTVTVAAGDSLWAIAARQLPSASDAEVATAWPQWHEVNRAVIGDDPDLIHPGQRLLVPAEYLPATSAEEQP